MFSLGDVDVDGKDDRVVLVFLAGGGLVDRGNRWSGIVEVDASVNGFKSAEEGTSSIVSSACASQSRGPIFWKCR